MEMIKEFKTISRKIAKRYSVRDIDSFWKALTIRPALGKWGQSMYFNNTWRVMHAYDPILKDEIISVYSAEKNIDYIWKKSKSEELQPTKLFWLCVYDDLIRVLSENKQEEPEVAQSPDLSKVFDWFNGNGFMM